MSGLLSSVRVRALLCRHFSVGSAIAVWKQQSLHPSPVSTGVHYGSVSSCNYCLQQRAFTSGRSLLAKNKHRQNKRQEEFSDSDSSDSEDESESGDLEESHDNRVNSDEVKLKSSRVDVIFSTALNLSRRKFETALYENRIYINGEKLQKKSQSVNDGDELDIVKGVNAKNPALLNIARIYVLEIDHRPNEGLYAKFEVFKHLLTENYSDPFIPEDSEE